VSIWLVAAGAFVAVQHFRSTPQKFMSYIQEHPLQGLDAVQRASIIDRSARLLNGLSTQQRREVKKSGALRSFFTQLTEEERRRFLNLTLPEGFRQMIATLNEMEPEPRKKLAERTLRDLRNSDSSELGSESDIEQIFSEGRAIFNLEASPQVKLDFAGVIAEVQRKKLNLATNEVQPN